jgi:hypothetical protein
MCPMPSEVTALQLPDSSVVEADDSIRKVWLTAYVRALHSLPPAEAEAQAEDAVKRYEQRWHVSARHVGADLPFNCSPGFGYSREPLRSGTSYNDLPLLPEEL